MNWIDEKVKSFADYIENPAVEHHWDKTLDWLRKALAEAHDNGASIVDLDLYDKAKAQGTQEALKPFKGALNPGEWEDSVWHDGKKVGTQEALAKVEEWVNLVKNEWFASKADTFAGQSECEHEADRLFAKISTYLQQLKDNKTV